MQKRLYALENKGEAQRLENQALLPAYQIEEELQGFQIQPGDQVLDAGCGSGILSRYLVARFDSPGSHGKAAGITVEACDISSARLEAAASLAQTPEHRRIRFFTSDLTSIQAPNQKYDKVICRFVLEHTLNPSEIMAEFSRVIRPGGELRIIDWDGIVLNLHPVSQELHSMLQTLEKNYPGDLRIGRKLPQLLTEAGFKDVRWSVQAMAFHGSELKAELEQTIQRMTFAKPILERIFGSELNARRFQKLYCDEMMKPGSALFYNKFIVSGRR